MEVIKFANGLLFMGRLEEVQLEGLPYPKPPLRQVLLALRLYKRLIGMRIPTWIKGPLQGLSHVSRRLRYVRSSHCRVLSD